jgi:hypothetical protein
METGPNYAKLKKDDLNKLQTLEKQIGKIVLAYEPQGQSPYEHLSDAQIEKIRNLEKDLNVILLAYKAPKNPSML